MGLFAALFGAPSPPLTIDRDIRWKVQSALQPVADEIERLKNECARKDQCMKDAMDILSRVKRGQNTKHVLQLRDDAVAFLKVGAGEEGEVE